MWMLLEVFAVLLIITTALFIHEMGHASAMIMQNKKARAEIYMGSSSQERKLKLSLGRITCYLTIALSGFSSLSNPEELPPTTHRQTLVVLMGGPFASLMCFAALYFTSHFFSGVPGNIITHLANANLFLFVTPLIPFTYPSFLGGFPSDGLQILTQIKENKNHSKTVS